MEQPASLPPLIPRVSASFSFFSHTSCVKGIPCFQATENLQRSIIVKASGGAQQGTGFTLSLHIIFDRMATDFILNKYCSFYSPVEYFPPKKTYMPKVQESFVLSLAKRRISIPLSFISWICFIWSGNIMDWILTKYMCMLITLLCYLKSTCCLLKGKEAPIDSIWIHWGAHVSIQTLRAGVIKCGDGKLPQGRGQWLYCHLGHCCVSQWFEKFELDLLQHLSSWELCKLTVRNLICAS